MEWCPISVTPPNFVELEIIDTDPGLKGDTAGTGGKPATLSTGAVVEAGARKTDYLLPLREVT